MRNVRAARLYVIGSADGLVKVGRSADPETRLKAIAAANGVVVYLHHVSPERDDASYVEAAAHRPLSEKRRAGEWFDVSPQEAASAIAAAIREVDIAKDVRRCKGCLPLRWVPPRQALPNGARDSKKQINIRIDDERLKRIDALRRARSPIPSVTDLFHALVDEAYEREIVKRRESRLSGKPESKHK